MNSSCITCEKSEQNVDSSFMKRSTLHRILNRQNDNSISNNITNKGNKTNLKKPKTELSNMNLSERVSTLLKLQKTYGNKYVQRMVSKTQKHLKTNTSDDLYEQKARFVTNKLVNSSEPQKSSEKKIFSSIPSRVNNVLKSPGHPLDSNIRSDMESRFGEDFSQVRVHTDSEAAESASVVTAKAYTVGQDIVFGKDEYTPGTKAGNNLIAHELVHTVQQKSSGGKIALQRSVKYTNEDSDDLKSPRFKGDEILESCYDGEHRMTIGERGEAVIRVQQALIDLEYPLPQYGVDGKYGSETAGAVANFKIDNNITPSDGIVGQKTMRALDAMFIAGPPIISPRKWTTDYLRISLYSRNANCNGTTTTHGTDLMSTCGLKSCSGHFRVSFNFHVDEVPPAPRRPAPFQPPLVGAYLSVFRKNGTCSYDFFNFDDAPKYKRQGRPLEPWFGFHFDFDVSYQDIVNRLEVSLYLYDTTGINLRYKDTIDCMVQCIPM